MYCKTKNKSKDLYFVVLMATLRSSFSFTTYLSRESSISYSRDYFTNLLITVPGGGDGNYIMLLLSPEVAQANMM